MHRILVIGSTPEINSVAACHDDWLVEFVPGLDHALERLARSPFDVAILDSEQSAEPAVAPLRAIQEANPCSRVIVVGTPGSAANVLDSIREQAYCYFSRPIDPQTLENIIRQALEVPEFDRGIVVESALPEFLSLRLRCRLYTADRLLQFLQELPADIPPAERAKMASAFRELLLNAIEHGGKFDPTQWVRVSRVRSQRALVYRIQDPGEGFSRESLDHAAVSHPEDPTRHVLRRRETGMRPGGFGLLIASKLVDEVIYNERGNEVILIKHL